MKVIALLPVKNETWILNFSLKNLSLFCDEILILDDSSEDNLLILTSHYPKVKVIPFTTQENYVDMSLRRNILLKEGRLRNGTHFVSLDADETISSNFIPRIKEILRSMKPGETLLLPWIILNRDKENSPLYFDPKDRENYKDFIFCDDKVSVYEKKFLSETRTPGKDTLKRVIPYKEGYVLHFIYIAGKRTQLKQAWYRANELIEGTRSAKKINATYAITKNPVYKHKEFLDDMFTRENFDHIHERAGYEFYIRTLTRAFEEKGIIFFEPLDIWHIEELLRLFIKETGRHPKARVFPAWVLKLNTIKNTLKNAILLKYSLSKKNRLQ